MVKERHVQQVAQVQLRCWLAQMHHLKFLQFDKIISDTRSTFINRILLQDRIHKFSKSFRFWEQRVNPTQEYPIVDGPLSIKQYYDALDKCYQGWRIKSKNVSDNSGPGHQVRSNWFGQNRKFFRSWKILTSSVFTAPSQNWFKNPLPD